MRAPLLHSQLGPPIAFGQLDGLSSETIPRLKLHGSTRMSMNALSVRVCRLEAVSKLHISILKLLLIILVLGTGACESRGAEVYTTPNFVVHAPSLEIATRVARTAELYRETLAAEWLGETMPRWSRPCRLTVNVGQVGAGGATKFSFHRGQVFGWKMNVQGPLDRILDSVLPHEISHTIFACHFRRPLPRWADEGAATLAEDDIEKLRQRKLAAQVLKQNRRIPLKKLFAMKEYPQDMQHVMTLYAQGYSLVDFLVRQGGKQRYLKFLDHAHKSGWNRALKRHYRFENVDALERKWDSWVMAGSPSLKIPAGQMLAANDAQQSAVVVRSQSPDGEPRPVMQRRFERTDQSKTAKSIARGQDLHAPDPRAAVTADDSGLREAINAGWVPVSVSRRADRKKTPSRVARPVSFVR